MYRYNIVQYKGQTMSIMQFACYGLRAYNGDNYIGENQDPFTHLVGHNRNTYTYDMAPFP